MMAIERACFKCGCREPWLKDKQKDTMALFSLQEANKFFVMLPTNYGKPFCYQSLPLLFDALRGHNVLTSVVVVVILFVAIMKE